MLVYQLAPKEGESSAISNMLEKYRSRADEWADVNALHTKAMEQAAYDRNLFENASSKQQFVEMNRAIDSTKIRPVVDSKVFSFEDAKEAYEYQWKRQNFGKVVIKI